MVIPYLKFQGDCEEAFTLYAEAFSGKIEWISRHSPEAGSPAALEGKVMHAHVSLGEMGALNGSDAEKPVIFGDAINLIVHCSTRAQAQKIMDTLSRDGAVVAAFTPNPPPDDNSLCADVKDKFGYSWWLVCPAE